ncbi:MAG: alkylmercury lyase MerB [Candidatus Dormibacteraceae bacterium]
MSHQLVTQLCSPDGADVQLHVHVLNLLADGHPVCSRQLSVQLGWPHKEVEEQLARVGDLERDHAGRVVGWGLTLRPTAHHLWLKGKRLSTWCAFDLLLYPALLGVEAWGETTCPVTQQSIRFLVAPTRVIEVHPQTAVLSLVLPRVPEDCSRTSFCGRSHGFASRWAASVWQATHPSAIVVSVEDAASLARQVATSRNGHISSRHVS